MPAAPQNILVILLSEMGSIVLARPHVCGSCAASTRRGHPHPAAEEEPGSLQAAAARPDAEHMHTLDDSSGGSLIRRHSQGQPDDARSCRLDAVIDCELFSRVSALLSFSDRRAGARAASRRTRRKACTAAASSTTRFRTTPTSTSANSFCRWSMRLACAGSMPRNKAAAIRQHAIDTELSVQFADDRAGRLPQPSCRATTR